MNNDFHESYGRGEPKPPSERSTGIVFAVVGLIVAVIWRNNAVTPWVALAVAAVFAALSMFAASLLKPLNLIWFRFGLLLHDDEHDRQQPPLPACTYVGEQFASQGHHSRPLVLLLPGIASAAIMLSELIPHGPGFRSDGPALDPIA
jgi:hypothetical protein